MSSIARPIPRATLSRRRLLWTGTWLAGATAVLAACSSTPPPATPVPPASTSAGSTSAPSTTGAPAPAPAKPTEEAKPTQPAAAKPATTGGQSVELKIGGWYDKGSQATVAKQIEMFNQKFPNVTVSPMQIEFEVEKNVVMMSSGTGPDVFWVNNDQTAPWASRNILYALDDYMVRDKVDVSDLHEIGRFLYTYQGKTYGLVEALGALMIMYNPKLFEAAGVPIPPSDHKDPNWTLDALVERAKALTKRSGSGPAEQYGFFVGTGINRWFPFLWDFGADVVDNAEKPTKITFDAPGTRQAIQWAADLRLKHQVTATVGEAQGMPMEAQFENGRLAMICEGPWLWPRFLNPAVRSKVPWEVAPMPRGPSGTFTRMAGGSYGMSAKTKNPDVAWELLKFETIGEGQTINWNAELSRGMPGRKSMAEDSRWGSWFAPKSKEALLRLPDYSRMSPKHPNWAEVYSKIDPALDQVWAGKLDIEQGVKTAQAKMEEVFARVRG
jgi:multiple sugar transport system substrate-binding protein